MNDEKILEIARRHMSPIEGELDGGTVAYWEFWEEELLAFAQAVIKESRDITTTIEVPTVVWDKLKDVNTVTTFAQSVIEAVQEETTIKIPASVFVKIVKDVNTVKDLLIAMKAAGEE